MKSLVKHVIPFAVAVALVAAPFANSRAQAQGNNPVKPFAVISLANVDEQFADAGYLLRAAGVPELSLFLLAKDELVKGFDTTKPAGAYVSLRGDEPQIVGFVGLTDFKTALAKLSEQLDEPTDEGNGVLKFVGPQGNPFYVKEHNKWMFVTNEAMNLGALPMDPSTMLGGLPQAYNLAAQLNVQNIPQKFKDVAIANMRLGFMEAMQRGDLNQDREAIENIGRNFLEGITQLIEETDQVTIGWSVDSMAKNTYLDISLTAVEGSKLAEQMATQKDTKSDFTGFLLPDAAVNLNAVGALTEDDQATLAVLLNTVRDSALEKLKEDNELNDEQQTAAKEILGTLFDVAQKTVDSGKLDLGGAVLLSPDGLTVVMGGYVADGSSLDGAFKKIVKLAEQEPDFPGVKLNAAKHGDVTFHTMSIPVPEGEREARKLLGDKLDVAVGFSGKSAYLAFGKDSLATLNKVIDASKAGADKVVPSGQLNIALTPILRFAASVSDDEMTHQLAEIISKSKGSDKISITSTYIPRGTRARVTLDEGILRLVGQAAKQSMAARGGAPF